MTEGSAEKLNAFGHHRLHIMSMSHQIPGNSYLIFKDKWRVAIFPLEHDAAEPVGFFIRHEKEALLFIPDTAYVRNRFEGITILVIECNNTEDILSEKILSGAIPSFVGRRIRRNHLSLRNVKEFILANNMARSLREIWLIHLSDTNSSEERFIKEIQEATGVPVYVAQEGTQIYRPSRTTI